MASSAAALVVSIPTSSLGSASSRKLSRCGGAWRKCSRVCGIGFRGARRHGLVRMARSENDVVVEDGVKGGEKEKEKEKGEDEDEDGEPLLLRMGVSMVTEILRLFSNSGSLQSVTEVQEVEPAPTGVENQNVLEALREDYERAYFLTGDFTARLYADECLFADPTIQFKGRDRYQRNLKLLVPFFEEPKLTLFDIQEEDLKHGQVRSINAEWNLRTYLRLPWKPLIDVNGSTLYVMDANSKIVKHIESWSVSGREAVWQLFVPSDRAFFRKQS